MQAVKSKMRFYLLSIPGDCTLYKTDKNTDYKALLKRDEFGATLVKFSIHRCLFALLRDEYVSLCFQIAFFNPSSPQFHHSVPNCFRLASHKRRVFI